MTSVGWRQRKTKYLCAVVCLLSAVALGQRAGPNEAQQLAVNPTIYPIRPGTGAVIVSVFFENAHLDSQALMKLVSKSDETVYWQTTEINAQGIFKSVPLGDYDLEVSAAGYLSEHRKLQVLDLPSPLELNVALTRDPADNPNVNSTMLPKARKDVKRATSALKSGNSKQAQKYLDEAYRVSPNSPELNFLLGYLYFQKHDFGAAEEYLRKATSINPHHAASLTLLGRVELQRKNYSAARSALGLVLAEDADNWIVRTVLADTYLKEHDYERARNEAQIALETGKDEAIAAHLVLGQALFGLGRGPDAIQSLNAFLQNAPTSPTSSAVRALKEQIQKHPSDEPSRKKLETDPMATSEIDALSALPSPAPTSIVAWQPPGIDQVRPPLAEHVSCPIDRILNASGERVRQLVDDVSRFAAVEGLVHKNLDPFGNTLRTEERKFNYVAAISEPKPGFLEVSEYRADKMNLAGYPDHIASTGFAALALVFHPDMRENFQMTCEGLGQWQRKAAWLIRFRQRDDRPSRMHSYNIGSQTYAVKLKGRAWITADNFQVVRIESELVSPMPQIQLLSEHQIVEYGPVLFQKKNTQLWLPKSAEIYFHFRKHRYYRRHSFDHYMLFAVETNDQQGAPSTPETPPS